MTGEALHSLLHVAQHLPDEALARLVQQLPEEITRLILRLVPLSGMMLSGPTDDLLDEAETEEEASIRYLTRLLEIDALTRAQLPPGPRGRLGPPAVADDKIVCPN